MTNPYQPPEEHEPQSRPSTSSLRVFFGSVFALVGFSLLAEGIFSIFGESYVVGLTMFCVGAFIVVAGWFCFRR